MVILTSQLHLASPTLHRLYCPNIVGGCYTLTHIPIESKIFINFTFRDLNTCLEVFYASFWIDQKRVYVIFGFYVSVCTSECYLCCIRHFTCDGDWVVLDDIIVRQWFHFKYGVSSGARRSSTWYRNIDTRSSSRAITVS